MSGSAVRTEQKIYARAERFVVAQWKNGERCDILLMSLRFTWHFVRFVLRIQFKFKSTAARARQDRLLCVLLCFLGCEMWFE